MSTAHRAWQQDRPLWFQIPRLLRILWIFTALLLAPWQRRWPFQPGRIHAFVLVRDLHCSLPALVDNFLHQGLLPQHIFLLDSGSTSPACLATLASLAQRGCQWIQLSAAEQRFGPYAPWLSGAVRQLIRASQFPYLVTDPDLALPTTIPNDWLAQLFHTLNDHRYVLKAALPLAIDDITVANSNAIQAHEQAIYRQPGYRLLSRLLLGKQPQAHICTTDTTLALYRPGRLFSTLSIRLSQSYSVHHLPWYHPFCQTPEYHYYQSHKLPFFGEWSSPVQSAVDPAPPSP
jgi:hypothetical protein